MLFNQGDCLSDYYTACSYGRASFSPATTTIVSVSMPCNGTNQGLSWGTSDCEPNDYYGWQFYLEDWALSQTPPINLMNYYHRVMILPGTACTEP